MGYIETGDKTSVDVLSWVVLHSLITYERTRKTQRMSTQRAYKTLIKNTPFPLRSNCVLKSETWKMSSSLDRIIKRVEVTSRSCFIYLTAKGGKNTCFFFCFFFLPGSLSKGFALFVFHSAVCRQIAYGIMHRRHQLFENRENSKIKTRWWRGERRVFNLHKQI